MLKVVTFMKQGILVVRLEGELDVYEANEFRTSVDEALDKLGLNISYLICKELVSLIVQA